jgi:hypothetical protein
MRIILTRRNALMLAGVGLLRGVANNLTRSRALLSWSFGRAGALPTTCPTACQIAHFARNAAAAAGVG